jgi:UDP-N-acetylmuramoyl-L-alanine---L-glutamate ligase
MPSQLHDSLNKLFADKKILILGFAREGKSTARVLHEIFPKGRFSVMDKEAVSLADYSYLTRQEPYLKDLGSFEVIFKTAGIPIAEPALQEYLKKGGIITSQLNEFLRAYGGRTIGVTGTKGKSTTSTLIYEMLRHAGNVVHGGNVGIPAFDLVEKIKPSSMVVLEMSSYQLETAELSPHIAVILNLFPEHLNYHGTLDSYLEAKANITRFQTQPDLLFYDGTFPALTEVAINTRAWAINFSSADEINAVNVFAEDLAAMPEIVRTKNAPPAIAVVKRLGISDQTISQALRDFRPLPHRLENVGTFRNIVFYDDTLATVPEATVAAVDSLQRIDVIIIGGFDRGIDYGSVAEKIVRARIQHVITFPTSGEKIAALIEAQTPGRHLPTIDAAEDMEGAVRKCFELLPQGGTVLLSPASPSFGIFKDYEDKSKQYISWIKKLEKDVDKA